MTINGFSNKACAACKYQRRRCSKECPLAPYFPADQPRKFNNAHRLYGVANIKKILDQVEPGLRDEAMKSIIFESDMRKQFPTVGCLGVIWNYNHRIVAALEELHHLNLRLSAFREQIHCHVAHPISQPTTPVKSIPYCEDTTSTSMLNHFHRNNNEGVNFDDGGDVGREVIDLQQPFNSVSSQTLNLRLFACREQVHCHVAHPISQPTAPVKSIPYCEDTTSMSMLNHFNHNNNEGVNFDDGGDVGREVIDLQQPFNSVSSQTLNLRLSACREQIHCHVAHPISQPTTPVKSIPYCEDTTSMSMLNHFNHNNNEGVNFDDGGDVGREVIDLQQPFNSMSSQTLNLRLSACREQVHCHVAHPISQPTTPVKSIPYCEDTTSMSMLNHFNHNNNEGVNFDDGGEVGREVIDLQQPFNSVSSQTSDLRANQLGMDALKFDDINLYNVMVNDGQLLIDLYPEESEHRVLKLPYI